MRSAADSTGGTGGTPSLFMAIEKRRRSGCESSCWTAATAAARGATEMAGRRLNCNAQADMVRRQAQERNMECLSSVRACGQDAAVETEDVGRGSRFEGRGSSRGLSEGEKVRSG